MSLSSKRPPKAKRSRKSSGRSRGIITEAVAAWVAQQGGKRFRGPDVVKALPHYNRSSIAAALRILERNGVLIGYRGEGYRECPEEFRKPGRRSGRMTLSDDLLTAVMGLPATRGP